MTFMFVVPWGLCVCEVNIDRSYSMVCLLSARAVRHWHGGEVWPSFRARQIRYKSTILRPYWLEMVPIQKGCYIKTVRVREHSSPGYPCKGGHFIMLCSAAARRCHSLKFTNNDRGLHGLYASWQYVGFHVCGRLGTREHLPRTSSSYPSVWLNRLRYHLFWHYRVKGTRYVLRMISHYTPKDVFSCGSEFRWDRGFT